MTNFVLHNATPIDRTGTSARLCAAADPANILLVVEEGRTVGNRGGFTVV